MEVGEALSVDVATGNDPSAALANAVLLHSAVGAVLSVGVEHDEDCRCVAGDSPMDACTCEIVGLTIRRLA